MVRRGIYVSEILIDDVIERKIRSRRQVTGYDVRQACLFGTYERAFWHTHPDHGTRLIVECSTLGGVRLTVILQAVDADEGTWRLRTVLRRS